MHRIPIIGYVSIILTIAMSGPFHVSAQARLPQKATLKDGKLIVGYLSMSPAGNPIFTPANKSLVVDTAHIDKLDFEQNRDIEKPQKTMSHLQLQFWGNQQISVAQVTLTQDKTQVLLVDGKTLLLPPDTLSSILGPWIPDHTADQHDLRTSRGSQDEVLLHSGDRLFGTIRSLSKATLALRGHFGDLQMSRKEIQRITFQGSQRTNAYTHGWVVKLMLKSHWHSDFHDQLIGELITVSHDTIALKHALLGELVLPLNDIRQIKFFTHGTRLEIDPFTHHMGDETRVDFSHPEPEGDELLVNFDLETIPAGTPYLICEAAHLESSLPGQRYAKQLAEGFLRTELFCNRVRIDFLNRYITMRSPEPQRLMIPVKKALLQIGENLFQFRLRPLKRDPDDFDDFLLKGIALEFHL